LDGARRVVAEADKVRYLTRDPDTERWVRATGTDAESLSPSPRPRTSSPVPSKPAANPQS
jgi:hypothetical protein